MASENLKPVFGPPPTPAIFINSGNSKLDRWFTYCDWAIGRAERLSPNDRERQITAVRHMALSFELVDAFYKQDSALNFTGETLATASPLASRALLRFLTLQRQLEEFCVVLSQLKNGKPMRSFNSWQEVPLAARRAANPLLEKWRLAKANGDWRFLESEGELSETA